MEINSNNYEEFVIDFIDGKLNKIDEANLFAFLSQNPTLKEEFDLLTQTSNSIPIETITFDSSSLIKPTKVNVEDYSEKLIALIENDSTKTEKEILLNEINLYPELKKEYELFQKTKLVAETNIVYEDKENLIQKPARIIPLFTRISAIAAVFIAVIMVFYFTNNGLNNSIALEDGIVKAKQDSISNILKSRNNVPKQLQQENEKQMLAFGGVNVANVKKNNRKSTTPNGIQNKNVKVPIKENPLNNNNSNQSINPPQLPKKILSENGLLNNNIAKIDLPKSDEKVVVKENIVVPILTNNTAVASQSSKFEDQLNSAKNLSTYVKQQLQITAKSEVIEVNKPTDINENITLAESIGLNFLTIYNKVANHDIKVKKTYNNDGEIEKVRLVATGW